MADQIWSLEISPFRLDPLRNWLLLLPPPKSDLSSGFHRSRRVKRYIFQYLWISLCKSPGSSPPPLGVTATGSGGELLWHVQLATKSWLRLHAVGKPEWTSTYDGRVVVWESLRLFAIDHNRSNLIHQVLKSKLSTSSDTLNISKLSVHSVIWGRDVPLKHNKMRQPLPFDDVESSHPSPPPAWDPMSRSTDDVIEDLLLTLANAGLTPFAVHCPSDQKTPEGNQQHIIQYDDDRMM